MSKHKGPKRKRLQRTQRLHNAKEVWLKQTNAKNNVKSYAKWYGVDLICAITELDKRWATQLVKIINFK